MSEAVEQSVRRVGNHILITPQEEMTKSVDQRGVVNVAGESTRASVGGLEWGDIGAAIGITLAIGTILLCLCCCCCAGCAAISRWVARALNGQLARIEAGSRSNPTMKGLRDAENQKS